MELEKAKEILLKIRAEEHNIRLVVGQQAIDTILEELNNRIPRKDIEDLNRKSKM